MGKQILIKPIISEKADRISENLGQYTFIVAKSANKIEIRKAIEKMYKVTVESVNTMVMPSKTKRRNTKGGVNIGRIPAYKKAIITVADGEEIDHYGEV